MQTGAKRGKRKPKKPKRLRKAPNVKKDVEELSNMILAPSSLKKGYKTRNTAALNADKTKAATSPNSSVANNHVTKPPLEEVKQPAVAKVPLVSAAEKTNNSSRPKSKRAWSKQRKTISMLGIGRVPDSPVTLEQPLEQKTPATAKRSRKPKKPKRQRLNQGESSEPKKFFIPQYNKPKPTETAKEQATLNSSPRKTAVEKKKSAQEPKKFFIPKYSTPKPATPETTKSHQPEKRKTALKKQSVEPEKKFFIPAKYVPSPKSVEKQGAAAKPVDKKIISETGEGIKPVSTSQVIPDPQTPALLKPSTATRKAKKEEPSDRKLDINKSSTLPKKVKKPKRDRKTRNTLLAKTVNGIFKRKSNKRKSQTESDKLSSEEEKLRGKLKNKKATEKEAIVSNEKTEPSTTPNTALEKVSNKRQTQLKSKSSQKKETASDTAKTNRRKKLASLKQEEEGPPMPPRVDSPRIPTKAKNIVVEEAPPMPPRVDSPKIPKKERKIVVEDEPPPMPPRVDSPRIPKKEKKIVVDEVPPMPPRVDSPRVPKKERTIVVEDDEAPPMPPRVEAPKVPKRERKTEIKSLPKDNLKKASSMAKQRVSDVGTPAVAEKASEIPPVPARRKTRQSKKDADEILKPSFNKSSRKPNSGGSPNKASNAKAKQEAFHSNDKFRQSFWLKRGNKKPKEKQVRASLALLRAGNRLKPLQFKSNDKAKKTSPLEDLKTQYQKNDKFRASFWKRKTGTRPKKEQKSVRGLRANLKQFAGILENTLNKKPGEKEEVDVGQLEVDQGLLTSDVKTGDDGKIDYSSYMKMVKFRLPEGAIRQKMIRDKLTDEQIDYFFTHVKDEPERLEAPKEEAEAESAKPVGEASLKLLEKAGMTDYKKYITLAKNKMPEPVIVGAMTRDGLSAENQEFFLANINNVELIKPPETRFPKLKLEEQRGDWDYTKYKKMVKIKVPDMVIKRDMANDGLSPENIDFFYANIDQLNLLKSEAEEEEDVANKPQVVKPSFLSDIEGLKNGNKLKKQAPVITKPKPQQKKSSTMNEGPGLLSELKKRMQTLKRGAPTNDV